MKIQFLTAIYIIFGLIGAIQAQLKKNHFLTPDEDSLKTDVLSDNFKRSVAFRYADHKLKLNRIPADFNEILDGNFSLVLDLNLYERFDAQPTFWKVNKYIKFHVFSPNISREISARPPEPNTKNVVLIPIEFQDKAMYDKQSGD